MSRHRAKTPIRALLDDARTHWNSIVATVCIAIPVGGFLYLLHILSGAPR